MSIIYNGVELPYLYYNGQPTSGYYNGICVWPASQPSPQLPPYTIRLKYKQGTTPTFSKGTGVLVDAENNIWDLTYENSDWSNLLYNHSDLVEVIDANTTSVTRMGTMFAYCNSLSIVSFFDTSNVTYMYGMFELCSSLLSVPQLNTSNVTDMSDMFRQCSLLTTAPFLDTSNVTNMLRMFWYCSSITSVPLYDTSKVTDIHEAFKGCTNVQSGALALYQQASTQANPPSNHSGAFNNCGSNTQTGAAELAQIPSDWK